MAQKDYVSRGRSTGTRRKTTRGKKASGGSGVSKVMTVLHSHVLLISTEGDTSPDIYEDIVWFGRNA